MTTVYRDIFITFLCLGAIFTVAVQGLFFAEVGTLTSLPSLESSNSESMVLRLAASSPELLPFTLPVEPEKILLSMPILAVVIVFFRTMVGVRTFGVFAPMIIALSFLSFPSLSFAVCFYTLLLAIGLLLKVGVLYKLRLSSTANLSILLTLLSVTLYAVETLPFISLSLGFAFFPLIVSIHVIERAADQFEERGLTFMSITLLSTLGIAVVLVGILHVIISLPTAVLLCDVGLAFFAALLLGQYTGMRLFEWQRFNFVRA